MVGADSLCFISGPGGQSIAHVVLEKFAPPGFGDVYFEREYGLFEFHAHQALFEEVAAEVADCGGEFEELTLGFFVLLGEVFELCVLRLERDDFAFGGIELLLRGHGGVFLDREFFTELFGACLLLFGHFAGGCVFFEQGGVLSDILLGFDFGWGRHDDLLGGRGLEGL